MPIFQQDLDRPPTRRESAEGGDRVGDQVDTQAEDENNLPTMPSPPDQLDHSRHRRRHSPCHFPPSLSRKLSEESIRTELCEGPVPDSPHSPHSPPLPSLPLAQTPEQADSSSLATCTDRADLIERLKRGESPTWIPHRHFESIWSQQGPPASPTRSPTRTTTTPSPGLLPPPTITPEKDRPTADDERRRQDGMKIERPRSALHSGDFTHDETSLDVNLSQHEPHARRQDLTEPWIATSPPRNFTPFTFEKRQLQPVRSDEVRSTLSSLSSSVSTSFVYKPPTSPLFQSESNDEVDLVSPIDGINLDSGLSRYQRRHTLTSSLAGSYSHGVFQARRPSISSDVSPLQHASMVGSYEESILRGRMSTTPSKPLDFLAQIGVLGLGKCKSNLRCPPHVTLPFPAVFYSYATSSHGRSKEDDGPSPYVGQIDLENGLSNQGDDTRSKRKQQSRAVERRMAKADTMDPDHADAVTSGRKAQRAKRRSGSPRAPPGGSYRIPEKGQIQIIIKNPNKTAVKLFLVPYDLAGMEPGTKTFVRQRSYSNGPIIDNMPDLKGNPSADRPILRYLVHLHICCLSRGRFYLYKNIRVVFANRVPDGKEKLRNEITLPEPRFTPYKAIRLMHPPSSSGTGPGASLAADAAFRRRSAGICFGGAGRTFDVAEGFAMPSLPDHHFSYGFARDHTPVDPIPFRITAGQTRGPIGDGNDGLRGHNPQSPGSSRPTTQDSSNLSNWSSYDGQIDKYNKLNKGDIGYGGNAFAGLINGNPVVAESLLSQRLRSLGVEKPGQGEWEGLSRSPEE
ncbi:hypothetical protein E0Z10_g6156 [Xylaria hypoxylon]|uniref:Atos-like conserved domain-containing protein n=1 Tax=Xylaria hypoxylon TaxID=37992 RepID=A0A4Z0YGR9_9PEZI|nr:hypothetical protein E0Z10_g6156 [Xylaria hypoxylon]